MQVGVNIAPLRSGHSLRGIGYYTNNLLTYLKKENDIKVLEFTKVPEAKNVQLIHYPWFDLYFHTLPIFQPCPTVVTIHDVIPLVFCKRYPVGFKGQINLFLQKLALLKCKFIITDSANSKRDIIKLLKLPEDKIVVIPLAADDKFKILKDTELLRTRRKYNLPERFLMYAGDANWNKNLPFLIEGFNQLIKDPQFKDIKLVLAGGVFLKNVENINHPELGSLKGFNRKLKDYHLEDRVIRPGNIEDNELVAFYNLATIYIQPSLYEGFGLPVLQAFACGTPVVSSTEGSLPEVGGKAVVYFNPTDLQQFVAIVGGVLKDKSLQNKLSELGLAQASKFSWEKVAKQTAEVYNLATQKP